MRQFEHTCAILMINHPFVVLYLDTQGRSKSLTAEGLIMVWRGEAPAPAARLTLQAWWVPRA